MTQPSSNAGTGRHRKPRWPVTAVGTADPGVLMSIWAGLAAHGGGRGGLLCGGPVVVAAAGGSPVVITVCLAAGRPVLAHAGGAAASQQRGGLDLAVTSGLQAREARRGDCGRHVRCPVEPPARRGKPGRDAASTGLSTAAGSGRWRSARRCAPAAGPGSWWSP
jgi:hypothetical protein